MTTSTSRLNLPLIMPGQAQKHVTHNEALVALDQIVHLQVESFLSEPPENAVQESCYLVRQPSASSGVWADKAMQIACRIGEHWEFRVPSAGWLCWDKQRQSLLCFTGEDWVGVVADTFDRLGVGTQASGSNRFALKSETSLFDNDGSDHRLIINKKTLTDTASLVWQDGFVGHAEIGLTGNDDMSFRVSPDGQNWVTALTISAQSGTVSIPTALQQAGAAVLNQDNTPNILNLKGDIGANVDLNTFNETGIWHQPSNTYAGNGVNYPGGQAGLLTVISSGIMVYQTYHFFAAAGRGLANATFTRSSYGDNWTAWERLLTG